MAAVTNDWLEVFKPEYKKPYYKKLYDFISEEYSRYTVYPPGDDIFNAFHLTPLSKVKVVIIGQDPYHEPGQAHGLCFSVKQGVDIPPSLQNIYKELHDDVGFEIPDHGCLTSWAEQGVLLLNAVLTVRAHAAASHQNKGWEEFTDAVIRAVNEVDRPIVFLLWGSFARSKSKMLTNPNHLVLEAPHPSPLSAYRGFLGCRHFSRANDFLTAHGAEPVDWTIR
jgi:uracil-DNA glycosylase